MPKKPSLRVVEPMDIFGETSAYFEDSAPRRKARGPRQEKQPRKQAAPEPRYTKAIIPKSEGQATAMREAKGNDITFFIGPAGTGKTHMAVAEAVQAKLEGRVRRIVLSRPAVEAGEKLGFLPGGPEEKIDPYMRPLYDAILDRVSPQQLKAWLADKSVEIAPLAFMRGRTLSNCAIVVDEVQNARRSQLKMVLTRLGAGSFMILTADPSQPDIDPEDSGLEPILAEIEGKVPRVGVVRLDPRDVVRHPTVQALTLLLDAA